MIGRHSLLRLIAVITVLIGASALLTAGTIAFTYPAAAAVVCPKCYGFERLEPDVFVEKSMGAVQRTRTMSIITRAQAHVANFYGHLNSSPRIFVCATPDCYRDIGGGGSRGMALLDRALFLSPRGTDTVVASHELSHIELHSRLGLVRTFRRAIPQWFDEGIAVVVSDDRRYLAAQRVGDRCLTVPDGALPKARDMWVRGAAKGKFYAKAACRVSRWIASNGGRTAVIDLIDRVAQGTDFDSVYR